MSPSSIMKFLQQSTNTTIEEWEWTSNISWLVCRLAGKRVRGRNMKIDKNVSRLLFHTKIHVNNVKCVIILRKDCLNSTSETYNQRKVAVRYLAIHVRKCIHPWKHFTLFAELKLLYFMDHFAVERITERTVWHVFVNILLKKKSCEPLA